MKVVYGTKEDITSWMDLVKRVRWNFPALETQEQMTEHKRTVLRFMGEQRAICVKEEEEVVGVLLLSKKHNMICCLAVSPEHRRKGIGAMLVAEALEHLDKEREITVTTFREEDEKGAAPRKLYKRFGFMEGELIEEFGYPHQKFILRT